MINKKITIIASIAVFLGIVTYLGFNIPAIAGNIDEQNIASLEPDQIVGSVIVTRNSDAIKDYADSNDLQTDFEEEVGDGLSIVAFKDKPDNTKLKALSALYGEKVENNYQYKASFTPNDPQYPNQWNLAKISAPQAWDITGGSEDVTIAIIDSGVLFEQTVNGETFSQPDFPTDRMWVNPLETGMTEPGDTCWTGSPQNKQTNNCDDSSNGKIDDWRGWDFMGGYRGEDASCPNYADPANYQLESDENFLYQDNDAGPYSCDNPNDPTLLNKDHFTNVDDCFNLEFESACFVGHGTVVASVAAAATNNNQLVAGIDHNAKIMNLRALDGYGYSTTARITAAINYARENEADVINMSLGGSCSNNNFTDSVMETALSAAASTGIVMVAASGNDGYNASICYPASSEHVIAVGATNQTDTRRNYSNASNKLDVVAPDGVPAANAPSAYRNTNYVANVQGTSLSTPHVTGLASLLKSIDSSSKPLEIQTLVRFSATKLSSMSGANRTDEYGHGRVNMLKTINNFNLSHPDGTLVSPVDSSTVYYLEKGEKLPIPSITVFSTYNFRWDRVKTATITDMSKPTGATMLIKSGTIVQASGSTIYAIDYTEGGDIRKRRFSSWSVYTGLGYSSKDIVKVGNASLPNLDGPVIN